MLGERGIYRSHDHADPPGVRHPIPPAGVAGTAHPGRPRAQGRHAHRAGGGRAVPALGDPGDQPLLPGDHRAGRRPGGRARGIDTSAYETIFAGGAVTRALWISTLVTVFGTAIALTVTVLAAYGLSRPGSLGHRWLLAYFLIPFLVYPPLVPRYLVVTGLGLKDTIWALVLPPAISVFNLVVVRGFFQGIPSELLDSARIDGASDFRTLARIVLPLSRAVIAVVGLFYAVSYWNVWFDALLFIDRNDMYPIQRVLQSYLLAGRARAHLGRQQQGDHAADRGGQDGGGGADRRADRRCLSVHPAALRQGRADRRGEGLTGLLRAPGTGSVAAAGAPAPRTPPPVARPPAPRPRP
ncbi:carbohydrate ABC transporter permease [Micromonospora sp. BRA006-A]|nr:carbohydrate ABC transporter permease [Micromonospora sp. BRA006-A]